MLHKGRKINAWGKCTEINKNETFKDTIQSTEISTLKKSRFALDQLFKVSGFQQRL